MSKSNEFEDDVDAPGIFYKSLGDFCLGFSLKGSFLNSYSILID